MPAHIAAAAKFYVGLIAAVVTSLLAVLGPDSRGYDTLVVIAAIAGAIGVYLTPNRPEVTDEPGQ
jgi:hypothetical protein